MLTPQYGDSLDRNRPEIIVAPTSAFDEMWVGGDIGEPEMRSDPALDWRDFEIEESGAEAGHCECCGTTTQRVWGFIHRGDQTVGAYFVAWTQGKPDHGAAYDFILGKWGDSATKDDRYSVALDFRLIDGAPQFMVVDSLNRATSGSPLLGIALNRSDVIGTPLAAQVFALVDAVYMSDGMAEIRGWSETQA